MNKVVEKPFLKLRNRLLLKKEPVVNNQLHESEANATSKSLVQPSVTVSAEE